MSETDQIERLRQAVELEELEIRRRTLALERRAIGDAETLMTWVPESWGDRVDPAERTLGWSDFGTNAGGAVVAQTTDRRNGDFLPWWQTEVEIMQMVAFARDLAYGTEVGRSLVESLANYVIGDGFTYNVTPTDPDAARWAAIAQSIIDEMLEANGFDFCGEREVFEASRIDGEAFIGLTHRCGRQVDLRIVSSPMVVEPVDPRRLEEYLNLGYGLCWKYGIAAEPNRSDRTYGAFVSSPSNDEDWEFYPSERLVHIKLNTPRDVKRGMSDFYPVDGTARRGNRLLANTIEGASVQAAIAYIRQHAPGVGKDGIARFVSGMTDKTVSGTNIPGGNERDRNISRYRPGTVHDVTNGTTYTAGPMGSPNGPRFVEVVQAALRMVGLRWQMPEYMISGDASNGNFASTVVAESPFVKGAEARQMTYKRAFRELCWKAIRLVACRTNLFGGASYRELRAAFDIAVNGPDIAVRDRAIETGRRQTLASAGILSLPTWASEEGYDLDEERAQGATPAQPAAPPAPPAPRNYP